MPLSIWSTIAALIAAMLAQLGGVGSASPNTGPSSEHSALNRPAIVSRPHASPAPSPHGSAVTSSDPATALMINPAHTGAQSADSLTPPLRRLWQVDMGGAVSYPLIVNGEVIVTVGNVDAYWNSSGGARVVALDASTGNILWSHNIQTVYSTANATYDSGRVFVQGYGGVLMALDVMTGTPAWTEDLSSNGLYYIWDAAPTASNGVVYTVGERSSSPSVFAVDEVTGDVLWRADMPAGSGLSSPAVTATDLYVTWACNDYRLSLAGGATVWRYYQNCSGGGGRSPAIVNGLVYDHLADVILNASDGSVAGHFNAVDLPAFDGSTMFELVGGQFTAGEIDAVDGNGSILWRFTGDGYLATPPIVVNHVVYVGSATGMLYVLNEGSGAVVTQDWVGAQMRESAERRGIIPTAALGAGDGMLVVPASNQLSAWTSAPAGTPPVPAPAQSPPANGYVVTDLGTPDSAWQSHGNTLNASTVAGAVTYERQVSGPIYHAVTWSGGRPPVDADSQLPQGAPWGAGFSGISATGTLIGDLGRQNGGTQAFTMKSGSVNTISGMTTAKGINASDTVVGWGSGNNCVRAVMWQNGTLTDLGTLGGCIASAEAINDSNQVTGQAQATTGSSHAFLWQNGHMQDLGTLGGCSSYGNAINAAGAVVGRADTNGNCGALWQAFEYAGGRMVSLGLLPGTAVSTATGINASNVIVGYASNDLGDQGFVDRGQGLEALNRLIDPRFGWDLGDPTAIDSSGRIVGTGYRFGKLRAFLLTPISQVCRQWWCVPTGRVPTARPKTPWWRR
jgi:probable HAF family extracellular repeat protein